MLSNAGFIPSEEFQAWRSEMGVYFTEGPERRHIKVPSGFVQRCGLILPTQEK